MIPLGFSGSILKPLERTGGREEGGRFDGWPFCVDWVDGGGIRFGVVEPSPDGAIGGFDIGLGIGVGVWPGRDAGVYSVVWLAVGAITRI